MNQDLCVLFDQTAAASFDRQLALVDAVGALDWRFDLATGFLSFGDRRRWPVQLLGTESVASNTWLWAWANSSEDLPAESLGSALLLRLLGEQRQIPELTEPQLPLGEVNGHFFSLLARGVCRAVAYFRAPYDGGAAFLLLQDKPLPPPMEAFTTHVASVFPRAVASLPITNHRRAFLSYLDHYGLPSRPEGRRLVVSRDDCPVLTAEFDASDRLISIEATLHP